MVTVCTQTMILNKIETEYSCLVRCKRYMINVDDKKASVLRKTNKCEIYLFQC